MRMIEGRITDKDGVDIIDRVASQAGIIYDIPALVLVSANHGEAVINFDIEGRDILIITTFSNRLWRNRRTVKPYPLTSSTKHVVMITTVDGSNLIMHYWSENIEGNQLPSEKGFSVNINNQGTAYVPETLICHNGLDPRFLENRSIQTTQGSGGLLIPPPSLLFAAITEGRMPF